MKILFVGVFETQKRSTNTSQLLAFKSLGHDVSGYNYRQRMVQLGKKANSENLLSVIKLNKYDLVVFSKCNGIEKYVFEEAKKYSKTCFWFMDPLVSLDKEMKQKAKASSFVCCDKENVFHEIQLVNPNCFHVFEGFDETVDKPVVCQKNYDVSFIGNIYGDREALIQSINSKVSVHTNAYGPDHAKVVSQSRINLNFCTSEGASDRVYKILAAGGFLLTNDWVGREKYLTNGKHCVIFDNIEDLNNKIQYYLQNPSEREEIAKNGLQKVQMFTRTKWAEKIIELCDEI